MNTEKEPPLTTNSEFDSASPETAIDRRRRIGIMAGLAVMLSLAATFGANKAAENRVVPMPTAVEYELPDGRTLGAGAETGMYDIIPGEGGTVRLPGIEISAGIKEPDGTTIERTNPSTDVQLMEWARKFDVDPLAAEPRGAEAIDDTVARLDQLRAEGWHVDSITFQGFASDEGDDREGDNPGFGMPTNEKNIKLADKRADAVREIFQEKYFGRSPDYQDQDGEDMTQLIHVEQGQEVRDDQLAADIDALAESMDMPTDDLVMQFNRDPESLPPKAREVLEGLYGDRYVRIEIEASREVTVPGEENTDSIILIPILIPIFRRRPVAPPIPVITPPRPVPVPPPLEPKPVRPKFPHPPKNTGKVNPGHSQAAYHIKQPDTSSMHYGKGSGGKVSAYRKTTYRGNSR